MMQIVAAAHPIVVQVPSSDGGVSTESILVFIGGLVAAVAAIVAALVTTRAASARLETSLVSERERADLLLAAERERIDRQLDHERFLAQRAEASASIEQVTRIVARNNARVSGLANKSLGGGGELGSESEALRRHLDELREEVNVVAIRFGVDSAVVRAMLGVVQALNAAFPRLDELPLSDERKDEVKEALKAVSRANSEFLIAARESLDSYSTAAD